MSNINPNKTRKSAADGGKSRDVPDRFSSGWLDALDTRTALARHMRDRYQSLTDDLGGVDALSYAQRSLCERALWLEYWLASQERELAKGEPFDVGRWTQAANSLQGIFSKLGLQRVARDVPTLQDWIANKTREKAEAAS